MTDVVLRTPVVRFDDRVRLKLECLQPMGSYKVRPALSAIRRASPDELAAGVVTPSAGNLGQGVAFAAREAGVQAHVVAPETAPRAKLAAMERLGAELILVPHEVWWQTMVDRRYPGIDGVFVHPTDDAVIAGNATIGVELCEDVDDFDEVLVPWGGGGLTSGIAAAVKERRPGVRVVTVEPEPAAPLAAAFAAGGPVEIDYAPSFVDGAGGRALLPGMWERAQALVDEAVTVSLEETAEAIRLLASRAHVVAEGAGALALAAALKRDASCVCIVSGCNIDASVLATILAGETPR